MTRTKFLTGLLILSILCFVAQPVDAQVLVEPTSAPANATTDFTLRIVNPSDIEAIVGVQVLFAGGTKPSFADSAPKPGWSFSSDASSVGVESLTWQGARLEPRATETFIVTARTPRTGSEIVFSTVLTYSNGSTETWGGADATKRGTVVIIVGGTPTSSTTTTTPMQATYTPPAAEDDARLSPGLLFIFVGLIALVVVYARTRRKTRGEKD